MTHTKEYSLQVPDDNLLTHPQNYFQPVFCTQHRGVCLGALLALEGGKGYLKSRLVGARFQVLCDFT